MRAKKGVLVTCLVGALLSLFSHISVAAPKPNILFIIGDDATQMLHDPNGRIEEIANRGIRFNGYTPYALCSPTRVGLFTGKNPHNHFVQGNLYPLGGYGVYREFGVGDSTLFTWAQEAGYYTGFVGKFVNQYNPLLDRIEPGFNEWYVHDGPQYYNYVMNENGVPRLYGNSPDDYIVTVEQRHATRFLRERARTSQPFFLTVATNGVHSPSSCLQEDIEAIDFEPYPRGKSFNKTAENAPAFLASLPALTEDQLVSIDRHHNERRCAMRAVERLVGALIDTLRETGQLENTYIIYTTDHGFHQGEHRLFHGKTFPYEHDITLPIYMSGPGIAVPIHPDSIADPMVVNIDIPATIVQLTGAKLPNWEEAGAFVDGRSLVPYLFGTKDDQPWRNMFLVTRHEVENIAENPWPRTYFALRVKDPNLLYVYYPKTKDQELYFLDQDPEELVNVASSNPAMLPVLYERMDELRGCQDEECRAAEAAPLLFTEPLP